MQLSPFKFSIRTYTDWITPLKYVQVLLTLIAFDLLTFVAFIAFINVNIEIISVPRPVPPVEVTRLEN